MGLTRKLILAFSVSSLLFPFPRLAEAVDLELTELLEALKAQMKLLEETGRKDPMWRVKEAKLRAQFVLVKKGEAGLKAVVTVGGEYSKEAVQEITLDLTPLRPMKVEAPGELKNASVVGVDLKAGRVFLAPTWDFPAALAWPMAIVVDKNTKVIDTTGKAKTLTDLRSGMSGDIHWSLATKTDEPKADLIVIKSPAEKTPLAPPPK